MKSSEQINELAKALCAAQAQMVAAKKSEKNPYFKSSYADLANVIANDRKALTDNGLCVVQGATVLSFTETPEPMVSITTRLIHVSGQWIEETAGARPKDMLPQSVGACLTYLRRYGYQAMVGATAEGEDDDGETAQGRGDSKPAEKPVANHDPIAEEKKYLRRAYKQILKNIHLMPLPEGVKDVEARIALMDKTVKTIKENVPSLRFQIKRWQDELEPYVKQADAAAYKEWVEEFNARVEAEGVVF
jgi:uncharacterized coiled-coil protein SlyX